MSTRNTQRIGHFKIVSLLGLAAITLLGCSVTDDALNSKSNVVANEVMGKLNLPEGVTLLEQVTKTGDEIVIPYTKYLLNNGLTVICMKINLTP